MQEFDAAMVDLYVEGSDQSEKTIAKMMDEETFIRGKKAVDLGFAAGTLSADEINESTDNTNANSLRKVDAAMAKAGVPRSERRQLLQDLKSSTPSAAGGITPNADVSDTQNAVAPDLSALINASKSLLAQ
jgi:ATP-dependent Clp protease, protease subunit